MALDVGSRIAHYDVTALIGEGGMGQVFIQGLTMRTAILMVSLLWVMSDEAVAQQVPTVRVVQTSVVVSEALGFGDLVGGHAGGAGVANPARPLTPTTWTTNCGVSVATTTRSQHRR